MLQYIRLSSSSGKKIKQDHIDHAINFSLTAWHLADNVFNYPDTQSTLKEKGIVDWKAFIEHVYSLCPELKICHDLSIIYKHYYNSSAKTVKSAAQVSEGGVAKIIGVPISKIAKINGVPISQIAKINGVSISSEEKLIIKTTDGTELNFMDIATAVNTFWQKELESLKT
jgi:hypothetical protein